MLVTLKRAMGEIASTTRGTSSLHSLVLASYLSFDLSLAFPFVFRVMVPTIGFLLDFLPWHSLTKILEILKGFMSVLRLVPFLLCIGAFIDKVCQFTPFTK
jgi:hypothetical protein